MNLVFDGGTADQQQSVRLMLDSDPATNYPYLDADNEPYNHHQTGGLWVMGYGSWWPTWTISFVAADTFSVDDWGPHAEGSATVNSDGSATIQLADDLDVPLLYDVLMHMVGHVIIDYITQFDGPQDELTAAVHGTAPYWDVTGDNVQEGAAEAFKDLALMGRRARDTLSSFRVTRDTITSLARTMNSDGADGSHQHSGWGWRNPTPAFGPPGNNGSYNVLTVDLVTPMPVISRVTTTYTQAPITEPPPWTDGMEGSPDGQGQGQIYSYGGHIWISPSVSPMVPIGTGGWIDEGLVADWESFTWPGGFSDALVFSYGPVRHPEHDQMRGPGSLYGEILINPFIAHNTLIMSNDGFSQQFYLPASDSWLGTAMPNFTVDLPTGVINRSQWLFGNATGVLDYTDGAHTGAYGDDGFNTGSPPLESGGASVFVNTTLDVVAPWPYSGNVAAGDFTTGMREFPH